MRVRLRILASMFVALLATPAVLIGAAGPSAASPPARVQGTLPCFTNTSGRDTISFVSPLTGVVVFDTTAPVDMTNVTGGIAHERVTGNRYAATVAGTTHTIDITGPPSTACSVNYAVDATPANDDPTAPELLTGLSGSAQGSTRAATNPVGDPSPTAGALRVVWYQWSGPSGTATFTAEPRVSGGTTDAGNGGTSTGVAVYDAADLNTLLGVGGDGIAYQETGGDGGSTTVPVVAGNDYLIAVFSAGGTGTFASQFGYISAGAFDLTYDVRATPIAQDDVAQTTSAAPVTIDVLANDVDPDGGPLDVVSWAVLGGTSSTVDRDSVDPNLLVFTPGSDAGNFEYFTYEIEDDEGDTDTALVAVYVDVAIPSFTLDVSPSPIDFGEVPLGKTADIDLTITNTGSTSVGPMFANIEQAPPEPFDIGLPGVHCIDGPLSPGDSCVLKVRFWSIGLADAASPATLWLRGFSSPDPLAAVTLFASTGPAVPTGTPNTDPSAVDDAVGATAATQQTIDALFNDSDPDADQLRISGATGAQHGTIDGIVRCANFIFGSTQNTCVNYTANPGFVGIDQITYTITDSRGRSDSATIYVAVANATSRPDPRVDSVTPTHGPDQGGHIVTVDGANFVPGASIILDCGGSQFFFADATFVSTARVTFTVPSGMPAGAVCDVTVVVQLFFGLAGTLADGYTVDGGVLPTVLPGGGAIVEGDTGTRTMNVAVGLSAASTQPVTVQWRTLELAGTPYADGANDYVPASGQVTFQPGQTSKTVPITVNGDGRDEPDEYVFVSWHTPTNAVIGGFYGLGYGIIRDDDPAPTVLPGLARITEGDTGTTQIDVPVSLSTASGKTVTVAWTTVPAIGTGFALAPGDYTAASGAVTFDPGETSKTVPVVINGDTLFEADEYVVVSFRNPTNAVLGGFYGLGLGLIENDD